MRYKGIKAVASVEKETEACINGTCDMATLPNVVSEHGLIAIKRFIATKR